MSQNAAIETNELSKTFKDRTGPVHAVRGVDLCVLPGEIFGFLGPNGAGKSTTLRMLTTLLPIDGGEAYVAGVDVARRPDAVRRRIGFVGQAGGADLPATGWENLILQGQLYGASREGAVKRATELVELLDLTEFADRKAATYSGGQRRRLEIALGIMHRPEVLFLDEPTTGLDPQNRANLWQHLRELRAQGTTIFLTTHYLEEADALADRVAIIDHGRIVAEGSPHTLKQQLAGDSVILKPRSGVIPLDVLFHELCGQQYVRDGYIEDDAIRLYVANGTGTLPHIFELLKQRNVEIETISLSEPSLDDVFLQTTGRSQRDAGHSQPEDVAA